MKNRKEEKEIEENPYHKDHFKYDEDEDTYECPEGKPLEFQKDTVTKGKKSSHYACQLKDCVSCSENEKCITTKSDRKKGYRTIADDGFNLYRKEMREKMQELDSKEIYKKRSSEVEPVFGQIKWNRKINRFSLRGLEKVRTEMVWIAIAHNLGKILRHQQKKGQNSESKVNLTMKYT